MNFEVTDTTSAHIAADTIIPLLIEATKNDNAERVEEINTFLAKMSVAKFISSDTLTTLMDHYTIIHTFNTLDFDAIKRIRLNNLVLEI